MVAGATGVDLFLLVIAADDGVMPQTVEHLAIIELLGVRDGVVALTKADLVDEELLELAEADVREFLEATPFAGCEVVTVSARDGRGLDELLAALERAAGRARGGPPRRPGPPARGPRLPAQGHRHGRHRHAVARRDPRRGRAGRRARRRARRRAQRAGARPRDRGGARRQPRRREPARPRPRRRRRAATGWWRPSSPGTSGRRFDAWVSRAARRPAAALGRPGAAAPRHGAVPGPRRAARGPRDRAGHGGRGGRAAGRATPLVLPHDRFILRALSPVATVGRRRGARWPARSAGTRASGTAPSSPRCAPATRAPRSRRSRRTAARPG